jgi:microcystin degradation protein MlrC
MRFALLGLAHETNTFSPVVTDLAKFASDGTVRGEAIIDKHRTAHTTLAGFLAAAEGAGVEAVPLMWAWANPSGTIPAETFESLCDEMLDMLREQGPWDGVMLAQHGACVSEEHPDADGEFVRRVRQTVGDIPIGVAYDMHANVSQRVVDQATVVVGYLTNPHVDARERAWECGDLVIRTARGEITPTMAFRQLNVAISILRQSTLDDPMAGIMTRAATVLDESGVLSHSVWEGYPYADVEAMGMSCLVVTDGDEALATSMCDRIANDLWQHRDQFQGTAVAPEQAVTFVSDDGPVVLLDVGDNVGGGGDGRSTVLLEAMIAAGVGGGVVILHEQLAVDECLAAGIGAEVTLKLGVGAVDVDGKPRSLTITGTVRAESNGLYEEPRATHGGFRFFDQGSTVVVALAEDNLVVLTSKLVLPTSPEQLRSVGVEPTQRTRIVAKGVVSPRAGYEPIAGQLVLVDTPGVTAADLSTFAYHHRRRPMEPFETVN